VSLSTGQPPCLGPAYWRLLTASAISTTGDGVRFAALPLLAVSQLREPFHVAVITAATTLPWLALGLPAGAFADRWDRVRLMVLADTLRAAALLSGVVLLAADKLDFAFLVVLAVVLGIGEVVFDCASYAVLPSVVPESQLEGANGKMFATQTVSRDLLGHLLGGVLYTLGRAIPLVVDAASFVASALLLLKVPAPAPDRNGRRKLLAEIGEGLHCILRDRLLILLTVASGLVNAVYLGQVAIFVVFVQRVLGLNPTGYAALLATGAVGGVLGGAVASRAIRLVGRSAVLLGSLGLIGACGLSVMAGTVPTTAIGYFLMGFGIMTWNVVSVSLRQTVVPDRLLGRTIGVYRLCAWGTMPVGALVFGAVAERTGPSVAFGVGGVSILVFGVLTAPMVLRDVRLSSNRKGW
jgi:MFS family permease